jgi:hypothetical protein
MIGYTGDQLKASRRVKELMENIESLARLADTIATEANLDWNTNHQFNIEKSHGNTTISWYNSSESC